MKQVVKQLHGNICLSFSLATSQTLDNRFWKNLFTSTLERKHVLIYLLLAAWFLPLSIFSFLFHFLYIIFYALEHYCCSYYQTKHLPRSIISHSPKSAFVSSFIQPTYLMAFPFFCLKQTRKLESSLPNNSWFSAMHWKPLEDKALRSFEQPMYLYLLSVSYKQT